MKTKIAAMFLVFLLSISIAGCGDSKNPLSTGNNTSTSSKPADTSTPAGSFSDSLNSTILEVYETVLQNKAEFFSTDNKKKIYLNDFLINKELYGTAFKASRYTKLDMDGDKVPEVVLELSVGDEPEFYEVLHYMNGVVYGYLVVYRGLEELKADGTYRFSNGAADNGYGKMIFQTDGFKTEVLGYSQSTQGDAGLSIAYFINNKPVSKEAFDNYTKEQSGKKGADWHEFSQQ